MSHIKNLLLNSLPEPDDEMLDELDRRSDDDPYGRCAAYTEASRASTASIHHQKNTYAPATLKQRWSRQRRGHRR